MKAFDEYGYSSICEVGPFGKHVFPVHKSDIRPGWIGNTPVGMRSWYKDQPVFFANSEMCPLRGSKRGIAARNGTRVYEYDYTFADRLAKKIAHLMKSQNRRSCAFRCGVERGWWFNSWSNPECKCFHSSLQNSFAHYRYDYRVAKCDFVYSYFASLSLLFFVDLTGITDPDKKSAIRNLLRSGNPRFF